MSRDCPCAAGWTKWTSTRSVWRRPWWFAATPSPIWNCAAPSRTFRAKPGKAPQETSPPFEFVAAVEGLAAAERTSLRLGMSATVEIVVADKPDALLVPISAVQIQGDGTWLRVRDPRDGGIERRRVETGTTTLTQVEIVSGLRAGEEVLLAAAGAA